jgi:hypothetical protein
MFELRPGSTANKIPGASAPGIFSASGEEFELGSDTRHISGHR